jgi:hypothetical protein
MAACVRLAMALLLVLAVLILYGRVAYGSPSRRAFFLDSLLGENF